jgi:hypothetical protein
MAVNYCKSCRHFEGKNCAIRKVSVTPNGTCSNFTDNTSAAGDKHCRACRFYDGKMCSTRKVSVTPTGTCSNYAPHR